MLFRSYHTILNAKCIHLYVFFNGPSAPQPGRTIITTILILLMILIIMILIMIIMIIIMITVVMIILMIIVICMIGLVVLMMDSAVLRGLPVSPVVLYDILLLIIKLP